jgi:hypothetical protein
MKTDLEEDIEDQRHIAPNRQLKKLEDSIIERGHRALGSNEPEVRLKKKKQIEEQSARPLAAAPMARNLSHDGAGLKSAITQSESAGSRTVLRLAYRPRCFAFVDGSVTESVGVSNFQRHPLFRRPAETPLIVS